MPKWGHVPYVTVEQVANQYVQGKKDLEICKFQVAWELETPVLLFSNQGNELKNQHQKMTNAEMLGRTTCLTMHNIPHFDLLTIQPFEARLL